MYRESIVMAILFILYIALTTIVSGQQPLGYQLDPLTSYMILAPNKVRANEDFRVAVSLFRLLYKQLTVRVSIKIDTDEIISSTEIYQSTGTRMMQLTIPDYIRNKTYWLHVEGSIIANSSLLFFNRTRLTVMQQTETMFIQVAKPIYHQSQIVRFRVIPVHADLMSSYGSLVSVEVIDASGNVFRRWLNPMTNSGGIIELDFPLSDILHEGDWTIRAKNQQVSVENKFRVVEYWRPLWDVNVTMPLRVSDQTLALTGVVAANYTSGKTVRGNATLVIELREPGRDRWTKPGRGRIVKQMLGIDGLSTFVLTLDELRQAMTVPPPVNVNSTTTTPTTATTTLANLEVWVNATFYSWWEMSTREGWAFTRIYPTSPMVKFMGGSVRPFKPNLYFTVYMVVSMPDGSRVLDVTHRRIDLSFFCNENQLKNKISLIVPDNGLIVYTFRPSDSSCLTYRLQVNEYMVLTVQTNYPTDTIHYVVVANGNILTADQLIMDNAVTTRTFSIAVSQTMFPVTHVVAYFIKDQSEIVSDSLTFYTNYTNLNNVYMRVNRGKDLNQDTVEIRGRATPGSYMAFNVVHRDLYKFADASFLREQVIVDKMMQYNGGAQLPFIHTWYDSPIDIQRIYAPSPSYGADTNTTMNASGLLLFTDANFTKANFYHTCNETENPSRAFPCYSMTGRDCYSRAERCNGIAECLTWVDEMNCPTDKHPYESPLDLLNSYDMIYRLWDDGAWLWHSTFVKPDGKIQFNIALPKMNADWVAGAYSLGRDSGLSLMQQAHSFSGTRRFYMTLEVPEEAVWGEQLGVRACIFNNWDYWLEALVEIKASPDVRVVQVGEGGRVSAYSPMTSSNQSLQDLVFLEGGTSKYIYMPVLPREPGNTSFTICAYAFVGSNCETRTVHVRMNGITNYYHTAAFLDLTSSSTLFVNNFKIIVPQKFTIPERRLHRFVQGSQDAVLSICGDFIGPSLSRDIPFADTQNVLRMTYASAENVFFELGYNLNLLLYLYGAGYLPAPVLDQGLVYCSVVLQKGFAYFNVTSGAFANFRDNLAEALRLMQRFRQKGDFIYYANYPIPPPNWELDQAGRRIENPRLEWPNDGYGVATSSFYFLLMQELGDWTFRTPAALDMVHWLASERNHVAGFASTFDSLVALHALRKFALADTNRALYKMKVDDKVSSDSSWHNQVYINPKNYSTVHKTSFPYENVWGDLTMKAEGTGRLLLQLDVTVNVQYREFQKMPRNPEDERQVLRSFEIECLPSFAGKNNSIMHMRACGRWVGTEGQTGLPSSGMAVFEIGLPTGYVVLNDALRHYVTNGSVSNLRYARSRMRSVHFFFESITPNDTCITFTAQRFYPVANITQRQICSAYEYYEPGRYNNSMYNVVSLYTNSICNVCGSFACPYCPDFNPASLLTRLTRLGRLQLMVVAGLTYALASALTSSDGTWLPT